MTNANYYVAWNGETYKGNPPDGWYQADDGKWWPQGYGPKKDDKSGSQVASPITGSQSVTQPNENNGSQASSPATSVSDIRRQNSGVTPAIKDSGQFSSVDQPASVDSSNSNFDSRFSNPSSGQHAAFDPPSFQNPSQGVGQPARNFEQKPQMGSSAAKPNFLDDDVFGSNNESKSSTFKIILSVLATVLLVIGAWLLYGRFFKGDAVGSLDQPHEAGTAAEIFLPGKDQSTWIVQVEQRGAEVAESELASSVTPESSDRVFFKAPVKISRQNTTEASSANFFQYQAKSASAEYEISQACMDNLTGAVDLSGSVSQSSSVSGFLCWEVPASSVANLKLAVTSDDFENAIHFELN